ncbi:MAG: GGDEF domain-containing protein [Actinomycetota bacterium]
MSDARPDLATGMGAAAAAGLLAAATGRAKFALLGSAVAGAGAVLAQKQRREADALDDRVTSMNEQVRQLESAIAAQVQSRMAAEEAVKSLSEQLSAAEKRAGDVSAPIVISDSGVGGEGLTDPVTGLFNHEYFLVALDSRISAARRHLRPVAVALIQVVDGREGDNRPDANPILVAEALRETLRESDTATRLQDGRFGVVLEDTPENGAIWTMERVRRCLAESHQNLTLWAGVACYPAHAFDVGALIDRADAALTAAQDWHQDRIEVATAE